MIANRELLDRSLAAVWHPCTQMKQHAAAGGLPLIPIRSGEGVWLYDFDGQRYLDGISSWWVNLFGHCHPRINAALREQLHELEHVLLAGFTHRPVVELSERLAALTGGTLGHCFYASDGASATEIALKMSFHSWQNRGYTEKQRFLCLAGSYHGETIGALAVTDVPLFRDAYAPLIRQGRTVSSPDPRLMKTAMDPREAASRAAIDLESEIASYHSIIAALIVEPLVQCANGMAMYHADYLAAARAICDRYQVHLICDEIAVGCGRTGTFFAHEQAGTPGIRPDFLCLSKGITGGYLPLSIVMTTDAVYDSFYHDEVSRGFLHSHSYTGNALACRAALTTLDIFAEEHVLAANQQLAAHLAACLQPLAHHPRVRHLRQRGMIAAFDVATDDPRFPQRFYRHALANEILLRPIGNTVYFMPPYVISKQEIEFLVHRATAALEIALAAS